MDFVYHSALGWRVVKKKKKPRRQCHSLADSYHRTQPLAVLHSHTGLLMEVPVARGVGEDRLFARLFRPASAIPRLLLESPRLMRAASPPGGRRISIVADSIACDGSVAGGAVAVRGGSSHEWFRFSSRGFFWSPPGCCAPPGLQGLGFRV